MLEPSWNVNNNGTFVEQEENADASFLLSDFQVRNETIAGGFRVVDSGSLSNGNADDDLIGFIFAHQSKNQFYLFDWKATDQDDGEATGLRGMSVKVIDLAEPYTTFDFWNTDGNGDRVKTLYHNDIGWKNFNDYRFELDFRPGDFTIRVFDVEDDTTDPVLLDEINILDDTYSGGGFGFYNFSQGQVQYSSFTRQTLAERPYGYDVQAIDPDDDTLTYSLSVAPPEMRINETTGKISWSPTSDQVGNHEVTVEVSDGNGGIAIQEFVVCVHGDPTNQPPIILSRPVESLSVLDDGSIAPYQYQVQAIDPNGDRIRYQIADAPEGMRIDELSGLVEWQPTPEQAALTTHTVLDTFDSDENWQTQFFSNGAGSSSGSSQHIATGGNPDGHRRINTNVARNFSSRPYLIYALASRTDSVYTPTEQGKIRSINWNVDARFLNEFVGGISLAIIQDGRIFTGGDVSLDNDGQWHALERESLIASDFSLFDTSTTQVTDSSQNPDFSADGLPIQIGILQSVSNSAGSGGFSFNALYDNLQVDFVTTPEINYTVTANDNRGGIANQPVSVDSNLPGSIRGHVFRDTNEDGDWQKGDTLVLASGTNLFEFKQSNGNLVGFLGKIDPGLGLDESYPSGIVSITSAENGIYYAISFLQDKVIAFDSGTGEASVLIEDSRLLYATDITVDSSGDIYVSSNTRDSVLRFNPVTGELVREYSSSSADAAQDVHVTDSGELYVMGGLRRRIVQFDLESWAIVQTIQLLSSPFGYTFSPTTSGNFIAGDFARDFVAEYSSSGSFVRHIVSPDDYGLRGPGSLIYTADDRILFSSLIPSRVLEVSPDGDLLQTYVDDAIAGINGFALESAPPGEIEEPGTDSSTVYSDLNQNGRYDTGEPEALTDTNGEFEFLNLAPGTYFAGLRPSPGFRQTGLIGRVEVTVSPSNASYNVDFGTIEGTPASPVDVPPVFGDVAPTSVVLGNVYRYDSGAFDPDGSDVSFRLDQAPNGMTIHPTIGTIVWGPNKEQIGTNPVSIRVTDASGQSTLQTFQVEVVLPNATPVITSVPPSRALSETDWQYRLRAQDADGDLIEYRLVDAPTGMTVDPVVVRNFDGDVVDSFHALNWSVPADAANSIATFTVVAEDGRGGEDQQTLTIDVVDATETNTPPQFVDSPRPVARIGRQWVWMAEATDPEGQPISFSLADGPTGMTVRPDGLVTWDVSADAPGNNPVEIVADDGFGGTATLSFDVQVTTTQQNQLPSITSVPQINAVIDRVYVYDPVGVDADGDTLTWSLTTAPRGMSIDTRTGSIRWTPDDQQIGTHSVAVAATDPFLGEFTQRFELHVGCTNLAPAIVSIPPTIALTQRTYLYAARANDLENDVITWSLTEAPIGMTMDPVSGLIRWTPANDQIGSHEVVIEANDGLDIGRQSYTLVVSAAEAPVDPTDPDGPTKGNRAPIITSSPVFSGQADSLYQYQVRAVDPDGDDVTFGLAGDVPDDMQINDEGLITWTPAEADAGDYLLSVQATDDEGAVSTQGYLLNITINSAPEITSTPIETVTAGANYRYTVRATDADGDPLTYRLDDGPAGAMVNRFGRVLWQTDPAVSDAQDFTVTVDDGHGKSATQEWTVTPVADTTPPNLDITVIVEGNQFTGDVRVDQGSIYVVRLLATDNVAIDTLSLLIDGNSTTLDAGSVTLQADELGQVQLEATATDVSGLETIVNATITIVDPSLPNQPTPTDPTLPPHPGFAPTDNGAPNVTITSPEPASTITNQVSIIGTVDDPEDNLWYYRVYVARADKVSLTSLNVRDPDWMVINESTEEVIDGELAVFDPSALPNDAYAVAVAAFDVNGRGFIQPTVYYVDGNIQLDNFRLEFTDLSIPLAGIPISVSRVYDTVNADDEGDFGFGWSLGVQDARIQEVVAVGAGGSLNGGNDKFIPDKTVVYITHPDGRRLRFRYREQLISASFFGGIWRPYFEADPGIDDVLSIDQTQVARGGIIGRLAQGINPNSYTLTTKEGLKYRYSESTGLETITDLNGNVATFTEDGISHTSGESIQFVRDHRGRISQIIDPAGNPLVYQYNVAGDLTKFTNQVGVGTEYRYLDDPAHYLDEAYDSLGRRVLKAVYEEIEDTGQLEFKGIVDVDGNRVDERDFDTDNNTGVIRDANGNATTVIYDDRGNVTREIDADGNETIRRYEDSFNPDLETTIIDRRGFETHREYDRRGNLIRLQDEDGFTRFEYNDRAQVTQIIGPSQTDPGDGYADRVIDSFFVDGQPMGLTIREDINTDTTRPLPVSAILGPEFNRLEEKSLDSDHILLNPNDFVVVGFDEEVVDRPGPDLFIYTPHFSTVDFRRDGRLANVSVTTDGTTFTSVGQANETGIFEIDLADFGVSDPIQAVRIEATDAGVGGYVLTAIRTALGNSRSTSFEYDNRGNLEQITNALGDTSSFTYDGQGRRSSFTDFNGNTTQFDYTDACPCGSPSKVIFADDSYQRFAYDKLGNVTLEEFYEADDTLVERRETRYDASGRVTAEISGVTGDVNHPQTVVQRFYEGQQLDWEIIVHPDSVAADGTLLESPDTPIAERKSRITDFEYDNKDQLIRQTDAEGGVVEFRYDANANRIALMDPVGNITTWVYDSLNRVVEERDPLYWDAIQTADIVLADLSDAEYLNRIAPVVPGSLADPLYDDPSGVDAAGNVGADHVRVTAYDAEGNQSATIDRNGRRREFDYDQAGRLLTEQWFAAETDTLVETITFSYDTLGNMLTSSDSNSKYLFTYDALNRLETVDNNPDGDRDIPRVILSYAYDGQGNVISTSDDAGVTVGSTYDARNRLATRTWFDADGSGDVDDARVDFFYNAAGRESEVRRYSDLDANTLVGRTVRTYDPLGRSDLLTHLGATDELLAGYDYDYDFAGLLIHEERTHQDTEFEQSIDYKYDLTGQLVDALFSGQDDEHYEYDANGNRITSQVGTDERTYTTGSANQLESDGTYRYEYDGEGNQVKRIHLETGETRTFQYDHHNRLFRVDDWSSDPGDPNNPTAGSILTQTVEYTYDALGRRIAREVDADGAGPELSEKEFFVFNGDNVWADFNEVGESVVRYLFGNRIDQNIAQTKSGDAAIWFLRDRIGTVHELLDQDGVVVNRTAFEAFGDIVSGGLAQVSTRYLFTSREYDSSLDDYYYRARILDAMSGRFRSIHPFGFDGDPTNLYRYALNSPSSGIDPSGRVVILETSIQVEKDAVAFSASAQSFGTLGEIPVHIVSRTSGQIVHRTTLTKLSKGIDIERYWNYAKGALDLAIPSGANVPGLVEVSIGFFRAALQFFLK